MSNTEKRNPYSTHIDKMTALEMAEVMQRENVNAALAVEAVLPQIAEAIDQIGKRINQGGRLFYIGCGTSGRLGVLDASECPPTYGVSPDLVVGIIAGGDATLRKSSEGAEDNAAAGRADLEAYQLTAQDTVVGLSVAGNAAYVVAALEYAKEVDALAIAIACNADCKINRIADIAITPDTGAEVITGSTRMKAGTAQKMILNMLSTGAMIKYGRVYENFMIHVKPVNIKLRARCISIVQQILDCSAQEAEQRLEVHQWDIRSTVAEKG